MDIAEHHQPLIWQPFTLMLLHRYDHHSVCPLLLYFLLLLLIFFSSSSKAIIIVCSVPGALSCFVNLFTHFLTLIKLILSTAVGDFARTIVLNFVWIFFCSFYKKAAIRIVTNNNMNWRARERLTKPLYFFDIIFFLLL